VPVTGRGLFRADHHVGRRFIDFLPKVVGQLSADLLQGLIRGARKGNLLRAGDIGAESREREGLLGRQLQGLKERVARDDEAFGLSIKLDPDPGGSQFLEVTEDGAAADLQLAFELFWCHGDRPLHEREDLEQAVQVGRVLHGGNSSGKPECNRSEARRVF